MKHFRSGSYIYFHGHAPAPPAYDPDLVLLLHFDGPDGSIDVYDSSPRSQPIRLTRSNNFPRISTNQSKFGGSSLFCDVSSYVYVFSSTGNPDFAFGTGDFTIDFWLYASSVELQHSTVVIVGSPNTGTYAFYKFNGNLTWYASGFLVTSGGSVPINSWHHVAATRASGTLRLFLDGVITATAANVTDYEIRPNSPRLFSITGSSPYYVDELRILKGAAAWTANFTPPDAPYPPP